MKNNVFRIAGLVLAGVMALAPSTVFASSSFIGPLNHNSMVASTVPANGDINPYGVAVVTHSTGDLVQGDVLVSNFNDAANQQGTGITIVEVSPNGTVKLFASLDASKLPGACPGGLGLTTALVALRQGWVIVGSLPTSDGTSATAQAGCLIVLNANGKAVETISGHLINGPWDMTAVENGNHPKLFITNVLNGTVAASPAVVNRGNVVRLTLSLDGNHAPQVEDRTVVASGFGERTDPGALVIGPTGVDLASNGTLYVADTLANRIAAIPHALTRENSAGTGQTVSVGGNLNGPLGLVVVPGGDILIANSGDGNFVEITPGGSQVVTKNVDSTGAGAGTLFGLALAPHSKGVYFVNDGDNTLNLLH